MNPNPIQQSSSSRRTTRSANQRQILESTLRSLIFKSRSEPEVVRMTVDPNTACAMKQHNTRNRPLRERDVLRLARAMSSGNWKFNGDSIRFSKTGVLLDGQHRLEAIIVSGTAQEMDVMFGLEDDVFDTIDTGRSRTGADVMFIAGNVKYANEVASTIRLMVAYQLIKADEVSYPPPRVSLTPQELLEESRKYPGIVEAVQSVASCNLRGVLNTTVASLLYYLASDKKKATEFLESIRTGVGENWGKSNPAYQIRNLLLETKIRKGATAPKMEKLELLALVITAYNYWCRGKGMSYPRRSLYDAEGGVIFRDIP